MHAPLGAPAASAAASGAPTAPAPVPAAPHAVCSDALQALEARERPGAASRPSSADARALAQARRAAARACLGEPGDASLALKGATAEPLRVRPPTGAGMAGDGTAPAPSRPAPPPLPATPPAPVSPPPRPPVSLSSCDATGCWASDGTRLQRTGPGPEAPLLGPRGLCTPAAGMLNCR